MKKYRLLLLLLFLFGFTTGCTVKKINKDDYMSNIDTILKRNNNYTNVNAIGYQYYLPNGIVRKEVNDFNQKLISNKKTYYMYVDVVSYYHKIEKDYKENKNAFISKKITYKDKYAYVEVNEENNFYFLEIMYNYGKIECYVKKSELIDSIGESIYILSSIKYNEDVINNMFSNEKYTLSDDETYNIFESKKSSTSNFLKYVEEYDNYETNNAKSLIEQEKTKKEE